MKRFIIILLTSLSLLAAPALLSSSALAVNVFQPCAGSANSSSVCKDAHSQGSSSRNPVVTILKDVIQLLAIVIGVAAIIVIIVGGLRMVTSAGDTQGVATARHSIIYALVGLVVAVSAQAFVAFVLNRIQ